MRSVKLFLLIALTIPFISATIVKNAYTLSKDYVVTINGTSNLHNWIEKVETVSGTGSVSWNSDKSFNLDAMKISIEVRSIKSTEGSIMNNNTYKALKADANPEITIMLNSPVRSIPSQVNAAPVSASVNLTIAGVTKSIDMVAKVSIQEQGKLVFEGSKTIDMTEYNIKPPTALFGALKTGKDITISFKTNFTIVSN
jgi:polyisoprenoid-binding protein YceI